MEQNAKKIELLKATRRALAIKKAHDELLPYLRLQMPDPQDPSDPELSRYQTTPLARLLCDIVQKVEAGKLKRVCVSVGPQFGKSQILSRAFPAWASGRDPYKNIMLGAYNQDFANEFGAEVRDIAQGAVHQQVFPGHQLKSAAVDHQVTIEGGKLNFVGVGGSGTGKPADLFIVDDPIRNDDDAQSASYRNRLWKWFNGVVFSRCHDDTPIIVVHTRWHQDDLIGRLCDPDHPERNGEYAGIADNWTYINLPAVVSDEKLANALGVELKDASTPNVAAMFGVRKPIASLWDGRKSLPFLAEAKRQDSRIFEALYMGNPSPDDGDYFKREMLLEYGPGDLPKNLRKYGASDHAVSLKQRADKTVLGMVGVDEDDDIWILPDVVWRKMETDVTVEELLRMMRDHKPMLWWMESELISKSFGPFLRKRMLEEHVYTMIDGVVPAADKMTRARSIQGRMAMRKVHFPNFAPWWDAAKSHLLKFPQGANDDFVDFIAHIGMGLNKEIRAPQTAANDDKPRTGSIEWILQQSAAQASQATREAANQGW